MEKNAKFSSSEKDMKFMIGLLMKLQKEGIVSLCKDEREKLYESLENSQVEVYVNGN